MGLTDWAFSDETEGRLTTMVRRALRIIDGHLHTHRAAVTISITAPGEESSAIQAIAECAVGGALRSI